MRIALVYPEVYDMARFKENRKELPPFGVLYLAAVAEQAGNDVVIEKVASDHTALHLDAFDAVGKHRRVAAAQYRSGVSTRRELEALIASYGIEGFGIVDDNFIVNNAGVRKADRSRRRACATATRC